MPLAVDGSAVRLGRADAPAKVDLWVDYSCPHCQEYEAANAGVLSQLVARGDVSVSYHNIQFVSDYGTAAGSAAACVAVEDPQRWPAFNTALYANHSAATDGWSADDFRGFAQQQGVTGAALDCISQSRYAGWITSNTADAAAKGVEATPTLHADGKTVPTVGGQQLVDQVDPACPRLSRGPAPRPRRRTGPTALRGLDRADAAWASLLPSSPGCPGPARRDDPDGRPLPAAARTRRPAWAATSARSSPAGR